MNYIMSELGQNGVNLNKEVFIYEMNKMKKKYGERYEDLLEREDAEDLTEVFYSMNANSYGRIMAFLLLLYYERQRGVDINEPLRLVANVMKLNFKKSEETLWQRLIRYLDPYLESIIVCMFTHDFVKKS